MDKEEILGLLLSNPLVSDGKRRLREAVSQAFSGRMQLPRGCLNPMFFALHLVVCLELLSCSLPFLSNSGDHMPLACLPFSPELASLPRSVASFRRKTFDPPADWCPSSDCPSPLPCQPCTPTCAAARSRSWRYLTRPTWARTIGCPGRSSLWL